MSHSVRAALGDLLITLSEDVDTSLDEAALALEIETGFHNQPPLSETIIEERRIGP